MKLYTKEMFLIAAEKCEVSMIDAQHVMRYIDQYVTPIKLPSDEEVEEYLDTFPYTKHLDDGQYNDGQIAGAELAIQWMLHEIQIRAKLNQPNL